MTTRRSFIKRGLFGGALLALGGATTVALRRGAEVVVPKGGLQVLGLREYGVLVALCRRLITPPDGAPSVDELNLAQRCDQVLARTDETTQVEVRQLLLLFENALAGLVLGGRLLPFSRLPPEDQDLVLDEWRNSRLALRRTGHLALRTLVVATYFSERRTWAGVGYPGPPAAFHDPNAVVWKGDGVPRPPGPGVWVEP